jgi:hypothetical protein
MLAALLLALLAGKARGAETELGALTIDACVALGKKAYETLLNRKAHYEERAELQE